MKALLINIENLQVNETRVITEEMKRFAYGVFTKLNESLEKENIQKRWFIEPQNSVGNVFCVKQSI